MKKLKSFTAFVSGNNITFENEETRFFTTIKSDYYSKTQFIKDLRSCGYKVDVDRVKETYVYEYLIEYTNCEKHLMKLINNEDDILKYEAHELI